MRQVVISVKRKKKKNKNRNAILMLDAGCRVRNDERQDGKVNIWDDGSVCV